MFGWLASQLMNSRKRVVIINHRREIAGQIHNTLDDFGVRHGMIQAGVNYYNPKLAVHVASNMTLARRLSKVQVPDFVFLDECHHAIGGSTWNKIIDFWKFHNPNLIIIGWTATPERLSGEGLGGTFDDMIIGPDVNELIKRGRLSDYVMFAPADQLDVSGIHSRMGDFVKSEIDALVDKPKITGNAIDHYRKHLNGAPTLVFCNSISHATHVAEEFKAAGYRATSIDGKMNSLDRRKANRDFSGGQLNVLTSCDLVSEGYDIPGAIGCINLRPTQSLALCLQQWGRVLRTAPGKKRAIILDHVGNSARHGLPDSPREWTLEGTAGPRKKRDPDDISIRQCGQCGAINKLTATECRDCGEEFIVVARKIEEVEGELEEVDPRLVSIKFRRERFDAKDVESLIAIGRMRGMRNPEGWAGHVMRARKNKTARKNSRFAN